MFAYNTRYVYCAGYHTLCTCCERLMYTKQELNKSPHSHPSNQKNEFASVCIPRRQEITHHITWHSPYIISRLTWHWLAVDPKPRGAFWASLGQILKRAWWSLEDLQTSTLATDYILVWYIMYNDKTTTSLYGSTIFRIGANVKAIFSDSKVPSPFFFHTSKVFTPINLWSGPMADGKW